jgi:hypothetical protein
MDHQTNQVSFDFYEVLAAIASRGVFMSSKPEAPAKDPKRRLALGPSMALQAWMK